MFVNTFSFVLQLPAGAHLPGMPRPLAVAATSHVCEFVASPAYPDLASFLLWHQTPSRNFMAMFGQNEDECRSS
jgi:hypothetical protein